MKISARSHASAHFMSQSLRCLTLLLAGALAMLGFEPAEATDVFVYNGALSSGSSYNWSTGLAQIAKSSDYDSNYCVELGLGVRGARPEQIPKGPGLATIAPISAVGWIRYDAKSHPRSAVGTNNVGTTGDGNSYIAHIRQSPLEYQALGDSLTFWTPSGFRLASVSQDPRAIRKTPSGVTLTSPLMPPGEVLPLNNVTPEQTSRWPNSGYGLTALVPAGCSGYVSQAYNLNGTFTITSNTPNVTKLRVRVSGKIDAEYLKTDNEYNGNGGYTNAYLMVKGPEEQYWFGGESPSPITVGNGLRKPLLTAEQKFPAGRVVQGLVVDKILSLPIGQPIAWHISGNVTVNARASRNPQQAIWAAIKEQRLDLKILDAGASFTAVPPPVKPITGGVVVTPPAPKTGTVVLPGPSPGGTTVTNPSLNPGANKGGTTITTPGTATTTQKPGVPQQ